MERIYRFVRVRETLMQGLFLSCALFSVVALATITVFLLSSGIPFIADIGLDQFFGTRWAPLADTPAYGILPMLVASLYVTALSVLIGVSIGLMTALCLYTFCPRWLVFPLRQMVNLLSGIPSVVFGLFGMTVLVPFIRDHISPNGVGYGLLSAALVLSIMILPTVVSVSLDALQAAPGSYLEGALALGATREQATFRVMLPASRSGVLTGVVLAIGRAIGETMAVIMVVGNSPDMPVSLFQSIRTLTANIALGATEMTGDPERALVATGVVLFVFTLLLNVSFSLLRREKTDRRGRGRRPHRTGFKRRRGNHGPDDTHAREAQA